jgi:hypothetical protein
MKRYSSNRNVLCNKLRCCFMVYVIIFLLQSSELMTTYYFNFFIYFLQMIYLISFNPNNENMLDKESSISTIVKSWCQKALGECM